MGTKISPRIEGGAIKWYQGNAFFLKHKLLNKESGTELVLGDGDFIRFIFREGKRMVKIFDVKEPDSDGCFRIHMDVASSALFGVGKYCYDIELHRNGSETVQTIQKCQDVEVEGC